MTREDLAGRAEALKGRTLTAQIFHSSEQHVARPVLVLAGCDERRPRRDALPDLPPRIIAEVAGTTRSHMDAFMGTFKKCGFIEAQSGILYVNPARLPYVTDGDRRISIAASAALPQTPEWEERHWPLAG